MEKLADKLISDENEKELNIRIQELEASKVKTVSIKNLGNKILAKKRKQN